MFDQFLLCGQGERILGQVGSIAEASVEVAGMIALSYQLTPIPRPDELHAVQRPTMKFVATKTADQLDLQALHRVRERLAEHSCATAMPIVNK
jgi:hypothetical protein